MREETKVLVITRATTWLLSGEDRYNKDENSIAHIYSFGKKQIKWEENEL